MSEHRKIERTPEEQARINAIRERFQTEKPSIDELFASGEYEGPVTLGTYLNIVDLLAACEKVLAYCKEIEESEDEYCNAKIVAKMLADAVAKAKGEKE